MFEVSGTRNGFVLIGVLCLLLAAPAAVAAQAVNTVAAYTPHRVWDTRTGMFADFEVLAAEAAAADVVLFGERHDDGPTHRLQLALLERLGWRGVPVTLSLEMFERDVQPLLEAYLASEIGESEFLAAARPWANYAADYRPLVEHARAAGLRVVAANVPRSIASAVARQGLAALEGLPPGERRWAAAENLCPDDDYRARFLETMARHPMGPPLPPDQEAERAQRFYLAQCVKDEAMAESVAAVLPEAGGTVVHLTGAFHSDYRAGMAARVLRRLPAVRLVTVSAVPVSDLDAIDTADHAGRADYVIFTEAQR